MKITQIESRIVSLPLEKPIVTSIHRCDTVDNVLVTIRTDAGIEGISYLFTFGLSRARILKAMVDDLSRLLIGEDPMFITRLWKRMWMDINFIGHKGVSIFGISSLDVALWDILGKALGRPVYQLLGAYRDRIKAYQSGGLWLASSVDELKYEAVTYLEEGFRAMKLRVGREDPNEDVERVRAVREAIGDDVDLMVDANQGWTPDYAIQMGKRLEEHNIYWLEEPVSYDDVEGHARIAEELDVPIATGETEYCKEGMKALMVNRAADILMPDMQRIGGITEWIKVAAMAEAYNIPISPHLFYEINVHTMAAIPNGLILEYLPWWRRLFTDPLNVKDGFVQVTDKPGLGLEFDEETVERYGVK